MIQVKWVTHGLIKMFQQVICGFHSEGVQRIGKYVAQHDRFLTDDDNVVVVLLALFKVKNNCFFENV